MKTALTKVITVFFFVFISYQAQGTEIEKLYESTVIVQDAGQVAFREGARDALLNVLVRVSGRNDIATIKPLKKEVDYAYQWVRQFSYKPHQVEAAVVSGETPANGSEQELHLVFNNGQIDSLLKKYQQPLWPANRPQTVLWLVIDTPTEKRLLDATLDKPIYDALTQAAHRRGLPLILPQVSLSDPAPIEAITRSDEATIKQASKGYDADYIITGHINITSDERWLGRWFKFYQGGTEQSIVDTFTPELAMNALVDEVANQLSEQFAIWPGQYTNDAGLLIKILDIQNFSQYHQLIAYLEKLKVIESVKVIVVNNQEVTLSVTLVAEQGQFFDVLKLDNLLQLQGQIQAKTVVRLGATEDIPLQPVKPMYSFIWQSSNKEEEAN